MIEIYFGERIIYLTDEDESFYAHYENRNQLKNLVEKFRNSEHKELYIYGSDLNTLFQNFKFLFKYEEAAGGLVLNSRQQILVIKNHGFWQLPKGHVENNETFAETAIREVTEECNISSPTVINQLPSTFHCFLINNKWHLKRTYWFKMMLKKAETPKPQKSEGITEAKWVDKNDMTEIYNNSYKNLAPIWAFV